MKGDDELASDDESMLQVEKDFHIACKQNNIEKVKHFLNKRRVQVNSVNLSGQTALHWAVGSGNDEVVNILMQNKANADLQDKYGMNSLHLAAWFGHLEILRHLVMSGGDISRRNMNGYSLLHCAVRQGHLPIIKYIVEDLFSLKPKDVTKDGKTSFLLAAEYGHADVLSFLMNHGLKLSDVDTAGNTILHLAAKNGYSHVMEELFFPDEESEQQRITKKLIDAKNENGDATLHVAAENGHTECVRLLLESDAVCQINICNKENRIALHLAVKNGNEKLARLLIDKGIELDAQDEKQKTCLHLAAENNLPIMIKFLLQKGCNMRIVDDRGQTALHLAAESGFLDIADLLIVAGSHLKVQDKQNKDPLQVAVRADQVHMVDMLIKAQLYFTWKEMTEAEYRPPKYISFKPDHSAETQHLRNLLWEMANSRLSQTDWHRLALHFGFTEKHLEAIECQWIGKKSHKEHAHRMLLIWLHRELVTTANPMKNMFEGLLVGLSRRGLADEFRRNAEQKREKPCKMS
uniref:ankyrin repeat and death domain-containing protein 1A-like isoform X2 n=1 Tax=Myxine glutinosa TaxID=7769 RepID=UPI00358F2F97